MRNMLRSFLLFIGLAFSLTGCELITGFFEAGFWIGFALILLIILLVMYLLRRTR